MENTKMFSYLTLIDSPNFWDMVEKSQPKVSRQFEDEEKRGPKRCLFIRKL